MSPRCPVCRHLLRSDNTDGWICSARGGCGSEFDAERVESDRATFYPETVGSARYNSSSPSRQEPPAREKDR